MGVKLFSNDKSTCKDEIILTIFVVLMTTSAILLIVFQPEIWFITRAMSLLAGVLLLLINLVYIPALIYRYITNYKKNK